MSRQLRPLPLLGLGVAVLALGSPQVVSAHEGGPGRTPAGPIEALLAWSLDVPLVVSLTLALAVYLRLVRSVNAAHPANPWPRTRTWLFVSAVAALVAALLSPIDTFADDLLTVHMVQHLLLTMVAPPLLAASGIGTLLLRAADRRTRRSLLLPLLHSRVASVLTFPLTGWLAFAGVMWGSHFTELYNLAVLDEGLHALEHVLYLAAASLFWWPLLSPDPLRGRWHPAARILALLAQMPSMSFLAITIIGAQRPLYPAYIGRPEQFGITAVADQQMAGSLMWVAGDLAMLAIAAALLLRWFRHEEEETRRVDARLDRKKALMRPRLEP